MNSDSIVLESDIGQINGFPSHKIIYREGVVGKYESQEDKFHTMDILIIAHNREYKFAFEAADKAEFDKYRSNVEDMARTIKISEPKFQGINCYKETESPSVDSEDVTNAKGVARCQDSNSNKHRARSYTVQASSRSTMKINYLSHGMNL